MRKTILKFKQFTTSRLSVIVGFLIIPVILTGCLDDDDSNIPDAIPAAYVSLYNGSLDASPLDILVDSRRINNSSAFDYTEHTGYRRFYTGDRTLKFTPFNASNTLIDTSINLIENNVYSVFVHGTGTDLSTLVTEDEFPEASAGNALVRVVHLSPDASAVDLYRGTATDPLFENVTYGTASEFVNFPAGTTSLQLTTAGGDESIEVVSDLNFIEDNVYTIVIRGYADPQEGNENSLGVQVIRDFFNY